MYYYPIGDKSFKKWLKTVILSRIIYASFANDSYERFSYVQNCIFVHMCMFQEYYIYIDRDLDFQIIFKCLTVDRLKNF